MSGVQQVVVWLVGIVFTAGTVTSAVKAVAQARSEAARHIAQAAVESNRVIAEVRGGVVYPPPDLAHRDGLGGGA